MATLTGQTLSPNELAWLVEHTWGVPLFTETGKNTLLTAVAIALAESGGNAAAHNPNPATKDDSYGLWQINMYGSLGPSRRAQFNLKSNEELLDPTTNAIVAKRIWLSNGFGAWTTYTNGKWRRFMDEARSGAANPKRPLGQGGGPDQTNTQIGGKLIDAIFDPIMNFLREIGLRMAAFIGGAVLLIGALILVAKRGVK